MYKIMFVDDEEQNLFLMEKIIDWEELGFRVCGIALDGVEGIQVFDETEPDLVFVDIRMEEMDGLTLIGELKKRKKKAVYVIVTAYDEFSYAQKAISLGVSNYLLKPISRKEMIPMVKGIKEKLDNERKKETETRAISMENENSRLFKIVSILEECCFKKEPLPCSEEMDKLIQGRKLRSFELFSSNTDNRELENFLSECRIIYQITKYDHLYGIISDEHLRDITEAFYEKVSHSLKKIYMMQINPIFSNAQEFFDSFRIGFNNRYEGFYKKTSYLYFSKAEYCQEKRQSLPKDNLDEALRHLVYCGSEKEILELIRKMADFAEEHNSLPSQLVDELIDILFLIKSQLTRMYQERAFMILRHENIWEMHCIRTKDKLLECMKEIVMETGEAIRNILDNKANYSITGKAVEYILAHFQEPEFSANDVTEEVHLSKNYFLKIFKEEQGISFWDYVTNLRMEQAKKLLKNTDNTIYAISREVGYESQYHFSRKFKHLFGISPNEYRGL